MNSVKKEFSVDTQNYHSILEVEIEHPEKIEKTLKNELEAVVKTVRKKEDKLSDVVVVLNSFEEIEATLKAADGGLDLGDSQ